MAQFKKQYLHETVNKPFPALLGQHILDEAKQLDASFSAPPKVNWRKHVKLNKTKIATIVYLLDKSLCKFPGVTKKKRENIEKFLRATESLLVNLPPGGLRCSSKGNRLVFRLPSSTTLWTSGFFSAFASSTSSNLAKKSEISCTFKALFSM